MTVRVWFTVADMGRVRLADPDPFGETLFALVALRAATAVPELAAWRRRTGRELSPIVRPLLDIWPGRGASLDLLSLAGPHDDFGASVEVLRGAPRSALEAEVAHFARSAGTIPSPLASLLHADPASRRALAAGLTEFHDRAIDPYWPIIRRHVDRHRDELGAGLSAGGLEEVFASLAHVGVRWSPPVLELPSALPGAPPYDLHLDGRGLTLLPAFFFPPIAHLFRDTQALAPDLVVYQVDAPPWLACEDIPATELAAVLGPARSDVLRALGGRSRSTSELARATGMSPSSASEHAKSLRNAGLVTSTRAGRAVRHAATQLGVRLLRNQ